MFSLSYEMLKSRSGYLKPPKSFPKNGQKPHLARGQRQDSLMSEQVSTSHTKAQLTSILSECCLWLLVSFLSFCFFNYFLKLSPLSKMQSQK
jgi:hypothetical protein